MESFYGHRVLLALPAGHVVSRRNPGRGLKNNSQYIVVGGDESIGTQRANLLLANFSTPTKFLVPERWICVVAEPASVRFDDFCHGDLVRIVPVCPAHFRLCVDRSISKRLERVQRFPVVHDEYLRTLRSVSRPLAEITIRLFGSGLYSIVQRVELLVVLAWIETERDKVH